MQYWFLLHATIKFILFMSHFQILGKIFLSVMEEGEANSCSVIHNSTLLGSQDFITFFTRKCEVGCLMQYTNHRVY